MEREALERIRAEYFAGPDKSLYLHIGLFMLWFSSVEFSITAILGAVLGIRDATKVEILVRGMDARVKCDRLRNACEEYVPMGPKFADRLDYFERRLIPRRNKLTHSMVIVPDSGDTLFFSNLNSLPYEALGMDRKPSDKEPPSIKLLDLFAEGRWLSYYKDDLLAAFRALAKGSKILEIDAPKTHPPTLPQTRQKPDRGASGRKRAQKQSPAQKRKTALAK